MTRLANRTDWKTKALPKKRTTISLDRLFSNEQMKRIKDGLVPREMEDKWFIYWDGKFLRFHRSWTGFCVYVVRFVHEGSGARIVEALVNRDPSQYRIDNDGYDKAMIDFLIDVLLLQQPHSFPVRGNTETDAVLETWSQIGRAMNGEHPNNESSRRTWVLPRDHPDGAKKGPQKK